MSFLTERYFQVLDRHKLYSLVNCKARIQIFMEHHVICVWGYYELIKSLHQEIIENSVPLNSEPFKEAVRLISEIVLEEQVDESCDGRILSHLELYLEVMEEMGCNMEPIFTLFDLLESKVPMRKALVSAGFSDGVAAYGLFVERTLHKPIHERATSLFYEGEPFIPDEFLVQLDTLGYLPEIAKFIDYWERHIEGIKRPGYSSSGRLVEVLCLSDPKLNREAELAAERVMGHRIKLWDQILSEIEKIEVTAFEVPVVRQHLHLVE